MYPFCVVMMFTLRLLLCVCQEPKSYPLIKKCACPADEVETNGGCEKSGPQYVVFYDEITNEEEIVTMAKISKVVVQPLECPSNTTKVNISDAGFISYEGFLITYMHPKTLSYCIEYSFEQDGKITRRIETCTENFKLRLCCQSNEILDAFGNCEKITNDTVQTSVVGWLNNYDYMTDNVKCNNATLEPLPFENWVNVENFKEFFMHFKKFRPDFCVGFYKANVTLYSVTKVCSNSEIPHTFQHPPLIPYCCSRMQAFHNGPNDCLPISEDFSFPEALEWPPQGLIENLTKINCKEFSILHFNPSEKYLLLQNGSLQIDSDIIIPVDKYCLGPVKSGNHIYHSGLICAPDMENEIYESCPWRWILKQIFLVISSLFIVATLIVYLGIPDLRRRIGGVCLISELFALLVSHITLIVLQTSQHRMSSNWCLATGVIEIIFVLASFFWLNIMCYDVWSTFRVLRSFKENAFRSKIFVKYSLYAWGIPLVVGVVAALMDKYDIWLKPNFSPRSACFFVNDNLAQQWIYLYGIILILLLINVAFFIHLAITIFANRVDHKKLFKGSRSAGSSSHTSQQQSNQDFENVKLYLKLFVVMGLPWLLEVFTSFAVGDIVCYIWILDLLNMVRGILIFVIFVCKKTTRDMILISWFPSYKREKEITSSSRKTSTMSLGNWLPSIHGRKISKVSMNSGHGISLDTLKEEGVDETHK